MPDGGLRHLGPWSPEGFFEDPDKDEAFKAWVRRTYDECRDMRRTFGSARNIQITLPVAGDLDESIRVALEDFLTGTSDAMSKYRLLPKGFIAYFYGTWADAEAIQRKGIWSIADGKTRNGFKTPNLLGKFPKGVASKGDSGDTGGAATHEHDSHTAAAVAAALADHDDHMHAVNITTDGPSTTEDVQDVYDEGIYVAANDHTHDVEGNTGWAGEGGWRQHADDEGNDLEHSEQNHEPPYMTLIPMVKTK